MTERTFRIDMGTNPIEPIDTLAICPYSEWHYQVKIVSFI
jgi:hypothetical protein